MNRRPVNNLFYVVAPLAKHGEYCLMDNRNTSVLPSYNRRVKRTSHFLKQKQNIN